LPSVARGLGLSALCAGAVLAGQHAGAGLPVPGAALFVGGAFALLAMIFLLALRPEALGAEAQSALARLIPRFARSSAAGAPVVAEPHRPTP
jgi:lipopolysaccharide exporter